MSGDDLTIQYSVRELLANLQRALDVGFTEIKASLANKADKADIVRLDHRIDEHGKDIGVLKDRMRDDEAATGALKSARRRSSDFRWKIATGLTALPLAVVASLQIAHVIK